MSRYILILGFLGLAACGPKTSVNNIELHQQKGVVGGTLVAEKSPLASGIVSVYDIKDSYICTGSIIAENFILTAAHCIPKKAQNVKIVFGLDVDTTLAIREPDVKQEFVRHVVAMLVHPDYKPEEHESKETDWSDIAIIKFQGPLPAGYRPVSMLEDESVLKRGKLVTVAGYGVSQVDTEPVDPRKVRNIDQAIEYGEVICDQSQRNCLKVDMSGDGVLRQTQAPISFVYDTEVRLDESKGHGTCSGDSGGPAYIEENGQFFLFGVTSRGSGTCDNVGVYTNAVKFKTWIAETLKKLK